MKSILFIFSLSLSLNAFAEDVNYNEFEAELSRLESNQVLGAPDIFVDEIVTNQAAILKEDDEVSKIIPLPGFEDLNESTQPTKDVSAPKRKRSF